LPKVNPAIRAVNPAIRAAGRLAAELLSSETIRTVQRRLRQLGFYSGRIDGIWGPGFALQRFQQGRGLQATGSRIP
jgi:peptidoglycan hydrolase-like protein with peptidoglycan-binding domain